MTDGWSWTTKIEKSPVAALGAIASVKPLRDLRHLGHAYVIPADELGLVTGFTALFVIDETTFSIVKPAGQRIAGGPGCPSRWIVACAADPRTAHERVAAVILECGRPVVKWKKYSRGDHHGTVSIVDSRAFEWLRQNAGNPWRQELAAQAAARAFVVAAGAPQSGGAFIQTSAGYGDGGFNVAVGLDDAGACSGVIIDFELDLARLRDIAAERARTEEKAGASAALASLEALDRQWAASRARAQAPTPLTAAIRADFARAKDDRSFGPNVLTFLEHGGETAPLSDGITGMYVASDSPMLCTFNFHGGPEDELRRAAVSLLPASEPLLWVRLGTVYGLFEGEGARPAMPRPWFSGGLAWLTALLTCGHGGQRYPADSPLKGKPSFPSALDIERVLVALGYPAHALLSGALAAELDDWRTPVTFCLLLDAAPYAEKHHDIIDAALHAKAARRQAMVLEVLTFAGVNPAPFEAARARLAKSKSKLVVAKLQRWEEGHGGPPPWGFDPR